MEEKNEADKIEKTKETSASNQEFSDSIESLCDKFRRENRLDFITFHPAYSYEEFVEGITANTESKAQVKDLLYIRKWGIFKRICTEALANAIGEKIDTSKEAWEDQWSKIFELYKNKTANKPKATIRSEVWQKAKDYVLIIDEINRGDISKILGELITLLESDKRLGEENEIVVKLPYSNDEFGVPPNIYIIGTMNTADRSIAMVDVALRRRFGFVESPPRFDILRTDHIEKRKGVLESGNIYQSIVDSVSAVEKINKNIIEKLGSDKQIGHSFFFKVFTDKDLMMAWQYEILPLLEEYYYCDYNDILSTLDISSDNPYLNRDKGIVGFKNIGELNDFLKRILNKSGA